MSLHHAFCHLLHFMMNDDDDDDDDDGGGGGGDVRNTAV